MKAVSKIRVGDPWRPLGSTWTAGCCSCGLGFWAKIKKTKQKTGWFVFGIAALKKNLAATLNNFATGGGHFYIIYTLPPDVSCDRFACHFVAAVARVLTLNKNLLAQPRLDAAGLLFTHQQEQKLTIWFICCLGLGRWGSWLKAVGRKWLIRKGTHTHTHLCNHGYCLVNVIVWMSAAMAVSTTLRHRLPSVWTITSIININQAAWVSHLLWNRSRFSVRDSGECSRKCTPIEFEMIWRTFFNTTQAFRRQSQSCNSNDQRWTADVKTF